MVEGEFRHGRDPTPSNESPSSPAVNMPSGEPVFRDQMSKSMIHWKSSPVTVAPNSHCVPPDVSCLYSVISRLKAVELPDPREFMVDGEQEDEGPRNDTARHIRKTPRLISK